MSFFQLTAVFFALFMMYVVSIHNRKNTLTVLEALFWYVTWSSFIVIAVFPHWLLGVAGFLQFSRVFDLLTVVALMVIISIVIFNHFHNRELSIKLKELVQKQAQLDVQKPSKKSRQKK